MASNDGSNNRDGLDNRTTIGKSRQRQRSKQAVELGMIQDFDRVLVTQISNIRAQDVGESEKDFALKFLRSVGIIEGVAAASMAFYGLNRFPRHFARYMTRKQQQKSYVLDKANPTTTKQGNSPFESPDTKEIKKQLSRKRNNFLFTSLELAFDLGMSFGVGVCVTSLTTDKVEAMKIATMVPMQPGRSLLSDQCCPSLVDEYKRQWKHGSKSDRSGMTSNKEAISCRDVLQRPEHATLQFILTLTQNCRHRQVMEQQIRENELIPSSAPVAIPNTGVIPQTEDPLLAMMIEEGEEVGRRHDLQSWSHDQLKDWVNDQDEE